MSRRIIEAIVLLLGVVITIAIVIAIPLKSYNEYKDYLAQVEEMNKPEIKPELVSITAELKDGVKYYANDLAQVKVEDFTVTANYVKGEESYSEPVEEGKFNVITDTKFYAEGGDITISYKGMLATITVELEPVVLESINVVVNPYTIKYAIGSNFDPSGMIVNAVYNDGSSKILADGEYTVDTEKMLTASDKLITVCYTDGNKTKAADVEIAVTETLDNGNVTSIVIVDGAIVNVGDTISEAIMEVNAVYESGNRKPLSAEEYTISGYADAVEFGKKYELTVSYNADATKTAKTDVVVRHTVQGEDGIIVGGSVKVEGEYSVIDGVITKLENDVTFAGGFSNSVKKGSEGSLTLVINSATETVGNITMRCSNSYNCYANGTNKDDGYLMKPLQINTILDLTVNGREVKVPTTVILKGCGPYETYAPLYGIYYEFTFEDVQLDAGINSVKFNFKNSTRGEVNCWGESPSTLNIDYVNFDTVGNEVPENYTISSIEISKVANADYAKSFDEVDVSVIATLDSGVKIGLTPDMYSISVADGDEGDNLFKFGEYTITVVLKDDPSMTASSVVNIEPYESFTVLKAGLEVADDKVYYVFSGNSVGYTAEDIQFFDGETVYDVIAEFTLTTVIFKIDVTDLVAGTQIYPHLKLNSICYDNGANYNGDIRGNGLEFTNGETVTLNGKVYTIQQEWYMPKLVVSEGEASNPDAPDTTYDANLDNSFESDKALLSNLVNGSEGVVHNAKVSTEYEGGIGGMDQKDRTVTYTFTVDADGKVDFIWNVAGNYWSGGANLGIEDMANHMIVTIDGITVDVSGIALPAGETDETVWWNLQQVVIKNVELKAGTHTFTCTITTKGSGLNIGSMDIYYQAN